MVQFSSYTSQMDRDYGRSHVSDNSTNDVGIGIQDIGMSVPMGIAAANVQGISAKIKSGAGALEIQFPGAVRGQRNAQTPGMYGEDQRQAIREMAKINEVNFTTHASMGINGLAGMDQQGNFSEENRKLGIDEIKRAIEFAADTAQGGSVVIHTGEFQRPISEESWAKDSSAPGGYMFKHYGEEPEMAVIRVVDDRTGQVMTQVRKNQKVARAIWNRAEESTTFTATKDNELLGYKAGDQVSVKKDQYVDYEGNPLDISERVPVYDEEKGRFKSELVSWDSFIEEAKERNEINAKKIGMSVDAYRQNYYSVRDQNRNMYIEPEEAHLRATLETQEGQSRGWAGYYAEGFEDVKNAFKKVFKANGIKVIDK